MPSAADRPRFTSRAARALAARPIAIGIAAGAFASIGLGVIAAEAIPAPVDVMPLSDVKPGMKGHGLTVFSGTTPERFDVEIISVLKNFRPSQDLILIKTPNHPRLQAARTVAGMSGSPIYINNKMIGAYAYGWLFGVEPVAGVTPIESMIADGNRPIPKGILPRGGSPLPSASKLLGVNFARKSRGYVGDKNDYDLRAHASQLAARSQPATGVTPIARASTPLMLGGLSDSALKVAGELLSPFGLEPLQAGGGGGKTDPKAPTAFVDGGAIGVELVRGDVSAMGIGTVTRTAGGKVLAFGHPMLGGGIEDLPTAVARVHWVLASHNKSFKIGEAVRSLGSLVNDRQSAIVVDPNRKAPVFPVKVDIQGVPGAPKTTWDMEVAHDQFMAPSFTALAVGSALETTSSERSELTWRATSKLKVGKYGTVTLADFSAGSGSPPGPDDFIRGRLVRAVGMLLNNPWEDVVIEGVETAISVTYGRETLSLRGAKAVEPEVDAGKPARIRLELQPFQGKLETREITVPIPIELADREVDIELAPGYESEKPQATPDSVAELLKMLENSSHDPESLVATVRLRETGAAYNGKVASRLPPGAADTLRMTHDSDGVETFGSVEQTVVPLKRFVIGRDTVRIKVKPVLR